MTEVNDNENENENETQVNPTIRQSATRGFSSSDANDSNPDADGARDPVEKHSALVGYMSVPVHRLVPIRRSTLLLIVLFLGFGTLCYLYPPNSGGITCTDSGTCSDAGGNVVGTLTTTTSTTSTTMPTTPTTTTVQPTTPTTSSTHAGSSTTTTSANQSTSTTSAGTASSTTTTQPGTSGSTTTSSAPGASGTGTSTTTTAP
ncbi:MAG: hypothetical protein ABSC41_00895 [Acidimicrobiales bacterium]